MNLPKKIESGSLDAYERGYMARPALFRQRTGVGAKTFVGASALVMGIAALAASWKLLFVVPLIMAWLLFSVLRVSVEDEELVIHFGWMRRRLPLDRITSIGVARYPIASGLGMPWLRRIGDTTIFATPGAGGRAVSVRFTDERGRSRRWLLASREPAELRDALAAQVSASHERGE